MCAECRNYPLRWCYLKRLTQAEFITATPEYVRTETLHKARTAWREGKLPTELGNIAREVTSSSLNQL